MKRLLIVSAHFPPTNAVDMHRVRLSLPHYRAFGYEPTVLCFDPASTQHPVDSRLCKLVPDDVRIERVRSLPTRLTRAIGLNAVGIRGLPALRNSGLKLIAEERPDVVLFSTTSFPLMLLGPRFRRACGAPYVLDFQDHWVSPDGSVLRPTFKNRLVRWLHASLESRAVSATDGLMAVSDDYLTVLNQRYPGLPSKPQDVIPFCAAERDLAIARQRPLAEVFQENTDIGLSELQQDLDTRTVGLYAGAYVDTMQPMLWELFRAVKLHLVESPDRNDRLRLWFVGSNYAAHNCEQPVTAVARECGVEAVIREYPARIPYYDALTLLCRASYCLLFGSTSKGYNPSKLFTLIRTGRPVLALVQPDTRAYDALVESGGAVTIPVDPSSPGPSTTKAIVKFVRDMDQGRPPRLTLNERFLQQYSAEALTQKQAELFERVIESTRACVPETGRSTAPRSSAAVRHP